MNTRHETPMRANDVKPFVAVHPGELLKDEIEFRGLSQRALARRIGVSASVLNEVLNCKRALNTEMAMMLEAAIGVEAAPLLAMQNEYNMLQAERDETFMAKLRQISRVAAAL